MGGETRRFPRTARVNEVLREVIAETLEREVDQDERLEMVTVTAVQTSPDFRHAQVFYSALGKDVTKALEAHRVRLQTAIAKQVRMKRTPQLVFSLDPSLEEGSKIDSIVRSWHHDSAGEQQEEDGGDASSNN